MMQNRLISRSIDGFWMLICILSLHNELSAQSWQYFQDSVKLPKYVVAVRPDANGNLWYSSGSVLGKTNGIDLEAHDFQAAGIQVQYNGTRSIAPAPDGSIWCSVTKLVLHYDPFTDTWTLHNPFTPPNSGQGYGITVDPAGQVYWSGAGWHQWGGASWIRHYFAFPPPLGNNIEENKSRNILIDQAGDPWIITTGSLGIETGIITPAGIIHVSQTDTVVYTMSDLGYPNLLSILACKNTQGYPMFVVAAYDPNGQNRHFRLISYEFGGWQNLGDSPPSQASINEIFQDAVGNVWMACTIDDKKPVVMRRFPDGTWTNYPLDTLQMTYAYSITATPAGDVWVGGRLGSVGVLAKLPVQPISATQSPVGNCQPVLGVARENQLQLLNLPQGASASILVFDVQGRCMTRQTFTETEPVLETSLWPKGVYFVRVQSSGECPVQTLKVVVN